jgi:tRNA 2-thiouridine synthesizing protein E
MDINTLSYQANEEGFLIDARQWTEAIAIQIAQLDNIELSPEHWQIIHFIRSYYSRFNHLPNARLFVKAVKTELGEHIGNSLYLYRLFPDGPAKYACKVAGLPKPPGCL